MPTGIALSDARERLFDAAERVLLRDGPSALTSRAVTAEAGVAKGVLHRHFADFEAFLSELVADRADRVDKQAVTLLGAAGTGTVVANLTGALTTLFESVAVAIVALLIYRDDLRSRLRRAGPVGVPVLTDATAMIASYLAAEQGLGRVAPAADVHSLAPMLVGTVHLLFADRRGPRPEADAIHKVVTTVVASVLTGPPP